jgi:cytochrome P450
MSVAAVVRVPGPKSPLARAGSPGQLFAFRRDPTGFLLRMAETYGEVVDMRFANRHVYLLSSPTDIEALLVSQQRKFVKGTALQATRRVLGQGLLTSEGDFHLRQRRLIQPIFHRQRIAGYADSMVQAAAALSARWADGQVLNAHAAMMGLTLSIVGKTLFGTDVEAEAAEIGEAVNGLLASFFQINGPFGRWIEVFDLPPARRARAGQARLNDTVFRMITEHRDQGDRGDLLSMLLAAQDEEGGAHMSDEQVRDEAMTLFLAGQETTANALSWTWHLLSQNPGAERQLHAELDRVLAGRPPGVADLPQLTYTRMVLTESMRLYPPAWVLTRLSVEPFEASGYAIPAGSPILASQWVNHHQARFFPEPFAFRPERWTPEIEAQLPRFAYFPFGGGPRVCIGESFAWMEGVLLIATLAQRWRMRPGPKQRIALQPVITLRPRYGVEMRLDKRTSASLAQPVHGALGGIEY